MRLSGKFNFKLQCGVCKTHQSTRRYGNTTKEWKRARNAFCHHVQVCTKKASSDESLQV